MRAISNRISETTAGFAIGTIVAEKYVVRDHIGQGATGNVYIAEQLPLGQRVALKVLRSGANASEELAEAMLDEARILASIEHEFVVRIIEVGWTDDRRPFIALEYVEGHSFERLLIDHGALPWRWAARAIVQVSSALSALHERGLLHLDVKPANCLNVGTVDPLTREPKTKLIDFGIARSMSAAHRSEPAGTPAYWAPEQALGTAIDERADVYCAAATFYELLTAQPPNRTAPRAPSSVNLGMGIPQELDALILSALQFDAARRPASAAAFARAIEEILAASGDKQTVVPTRSGFVVANVSPRSARDDSEERQLARLRSKVESFWVAGVLGAANDALMLARQRRTLEHDGVAGLAAEVVPGEPLALPEDATLYDLYRAHESSLLILGRPGSGKTTQLLILARSLLRGEARRVAVVFTLSTWTPPLSLVEWMTAELYSQYQVPRQLAASWIRAGRIIPLLDGLDDVAAVRRAACIRTVNDHLTASPVDGPGLVVTCRLDEYVEVRTLLRASVAIRLHDLDHDSVSEYLGRYANAEEKQRVLLAGDLRDLVRTPLMLTLLASLSPDIIDELNGGAESHMASLWDAYVTRVVTRSGKRRIPSGPAPFLETFERMAAALRRQSQTIFHLDNLQPGMLDGSWSSATYFLASRVAAAMVVGGGVVLSFGLTPLDNMGFHADLRFGIDLGLATAVISGALHGIWALLSARHPWIAAYPRWRWLRVLALGTLGGLLSAAVLGIGRHWYARVLAFEVAFFASPLLSPHDAIGRLSADIRPVEPMRFSAPHALRALPYALGGALLGMVIDFKQKDPHAIAATGAYILIMWLLLAGLRGREVATRVLPTEAIDRSLKFSFTLALFGFATTTATFGVIYGFAYGACAGLTTATVMWLWYGGFALIQHGVLRALLRIKRESFCDLKFLDAAANRGLLHRLGGGYMFLHPTLLEHMARRREQRR